MTKSLLSFDTDRIKSYVFATPKLKEIRAASAILDDLNRQTMVELVKQAGGHTIYANGGGGLFVVDSERVAAIEHGVKAAYRTNMASITGASFENYDEQKFQEQFRTLSYRLRLAKDKPQRERSLITHPYFHFCSSCGREYAVINDNTDDSLICPSCQIKRKKDDAFKGDETKEGSLRHYSWRVESGEKFTATDGLWPCLLSKLEAHATDYPIDSDRPNDFNELASLSSPNGYMGFIYADGDGMGKILDTMTSKEQMQDFAEAVDSSIYDATVEAIVEHLQPSGNKIWPFDILMLGGDDLVMVTRAQSAIEVALHVVKRFPELTQAKYGKPLRVSASVVIAHVNYPFGAWLNLAESGLKFAKKQAARRQWYNDETLDSGMLNFLVVNSANHLDFGEYYKQVLTHKESPNSWLYRTQRPYTVSGMETLLTQIETVQSVPRAKLEQLRQAVFKSRPQATLDCIMAILRLRNRKQRLDLLQLFGKTLQDQAEFPWISVGDDYVTPILDIAELINFIPRKQ